MREGLFQSSMEAKDMTNTEETKIEASLRMAFQSGICGHCKAAMAPERVVLLTGGTGLHAVIPAIDSAEGEVRTVMTKDLQVADATLTVAERQALVTVARTITKAVSAEETRV